MNGIGEACADPRLDEELRRAEAAGRPGLPLGELRISRRPGDQHPVVLRADGRLVHDPGAPIQRAALGPDGRTLALEVAADGSEAGTLRLVDVESGTARTVPGLPLRHADLVWDPDGATLVLTIGPRRVVALPAALPAALPTARPAPLPAGGTVPTTPRGPAEPPPRGDTATPGAGVARTGWQTGEGEHTRLVLPTALRAARTAPNTPPPGDTTRSGAGDTATPGAGDVARTVWEAGEGERARPVLLGGRLALAVTDAAGTCLVAPDRTELLRLPAACTLHTAGSDALAVSRTALYSLRHDETGVTVRATASPPGVVVHALAAPGRFWLHVMTRGHSELVGLDADLEIVRRVPVSADDDVRAVTGLAHDGDDLWVRLEAPARAPEILCLDGLDGPDGLDRLDRLDGPAGPAGPPRTRLLAVPAADGTPVELLVTDTHDGPAPVLVVAYGGFGVVDLPGFEPSVAAWCALGGRYVTARVRGSGGTPDRHDQGRGPRKANAVADLAAAARGLVARGLAAPGRIAFSGASHGGLVAASAALAEPGLVAAVTCTAAPLDPSRLDEHPYGAHWRQEFGDPADPAVAAAMTDYSPFARLDHHPPGEPLPAFLLTTFDQDARVSRAPTDRLAAALRARGAVVGREHRPRMGHGRNALDDIHDFAASVLGFARHHTQGAHPA